MASWKEYSLGDVISFGNGKERPKSQGDIPVYGGNGVLGFCGASNYCEETIIIGRVGAYCGSVYYENKPIWVSDNALAAKPKKCFHSKFLYYFLKQLDLNQFAEGSSHPLVTQSLLNSIEVKITDDIDEQRTISSILNSLDDKIDLLYRQNKTLEALAETLFRQWFVEDADDGWKKAKLGEFIEIKHGHAFSGAHIVADETDKILVTPGNFKIGGGFSFEKFKYYNADDFPSSFAFDEGDFIVTMTDLSQDTDTLGYPAFVPRIAGKRLLHNQRVGKVVFREDHSDKRHFIYHLMRSEVYRHYIVGRSTGMAVRHTSPSSICDFEFALPDSSIINGFEKQIEPYRQRERLNQLEIQTLAQLRDTLLPKLMSGEVRVKVE